MITRERAFVFLGGAFSVVALSGLAWYAPALADALELPLTAQGGDPAAAARAAELTSRLTRLATLSLLLGSGGLLTALGLASQGPRGWLSLQGRTAVTLAGCGLFAGALQFLSGMYGLQGSFQQFAQAEAAPRPADVARHAADARDLLRGGFAVALAGQVLLLPLLWKLFWSPPEACVYRQGGRAALPLANIAAAAGFSLCMIVACRSGAGVLSQVAAPAVKPSDVAAGMAGIFMYSLIAGILLAFVGATQALAGIAATRRV